MKLYKSETITEPDLVEGFNNSIKPLLFRQIRLLG